MVGTILNLINQGGRLVDGLSLSWFHVLLSYLVPYCVSSLKHLPENTARVFMMREFLEFETTEVCRELSLTTTNCNVILHRARNGLRHCLESNWFSAGEQPC